MDPVSYNNIYNVVTDLANHGMIKIRKLEYLEKGTFLSTKKKILIICASDDTF